MARSGSGISAIFASTSRLPVRLALARAALAPPSAPGRALSSQRVPRPVNPLVDALPVVAAADRCVAFFAGLRSAIAQLLDADQVARGIAEGAVADPVRLVGRLLDDLGVAGLQPLEGAVEVGGGRG